MRDTLSWRPIFAPADACSYTILHFARRLPHQLLGEGGEGSLHCQTSSTFAYNALQASSNDDVDQQLAPYTLGFEI